MPDLNEIVADERWIPVEIWRHTIMVAYRPGKTSLQRQAEIQREMREMQADPEVDEVEAARRGAEILCELVSDWDLTDNGRPVPLTSDALMRVPGPFFYAIMGAIGSDGENIANEKKASKSNSAAGSRQGGKQAPAQAGIPSSEPRGTWA